MQAPRNARQYCFKMLCPEELVSSVMGHGGRRKDAIQDDTGARLSFSGRQEYYPNTRLRVLCILHDELEPLASAISMVLERLAESAQKEEASGVKEGDFLTKEPGKYLCRLAIMPKMVTVLIGPRGVNVKTLSAQFHSKISVETDIFSNHQLVKVTATPEDMKGACHSILSIVTDHAGNDDFRSWAAQHSFNNTTASSYRDERREDSRRDDHRRDDYRRDDRDDHRRDDYRRDDNRRDDHRRDDHRRDDHRRDDHRRDDHRRDEHRRDDQRRDDWWRPERERERERSPYRASWKEARWDSGKDWKVKQEWQQDKDRGGRRWENGGGYDSSSQPPDDRRLTEILVEAAKSMPSEAMLTGENAVTFDLPTEKVVPLLDMDGLRFEGVRGATDTDIAIEEADGSIGAQQSLAISGNVLDAFRAHTLVMKLYHETDVAEDELNDQITSLTATLNQSQRIAEG